MTFKEICVLAANGNALPEKSAMEEKFAYVALENLYSSVKGHKIDRETAKVKQTEIKVMFDDAQQDRLKQKAVYYQFQEFVRLAQKELGDIRLAVSNKEPDRVIAKHCLNLVGDLLGETLTTDTLFKSMEESK